MKNKVRAKVISRKKKKCYFCGKPALSRHHIIPIRLGGKGMKENKVDICDNCHKKLHFIIYIEIGFIKFIEQFKVIFFQCHKFFRIVFLKLFE